MERSHSIHSPQEEATDSGKVHPEKIILAERFVSCLTDAENRRKEIPKNKPEISTSFENALEGSNLIDRLVARSAEIGRFN